MTHRDQIESAIREWGGRDRAELPKRLRNPQNEHEFALAMVPTVGVEGCLLWTAVVESSNQLLAGHRIASKVAGRREFKCLLTRKFATFYTSRVELKVDHEHAAGAAAKGTFATSRRLGNVKSSKVRQVDLEE